MKEVFETMLAHLWFTFFLFIGALILINDLGCAVGNARRGKCDCKCRKDDDDE